MKNYDVSIVSRQLPSAHAEYSYRVQAATWSVAVCRALRLFQLERHVRGRRLVGVEIHAVVVGKVQAAVVEHAASEGRACGS